MAGWQKTSRPGPKDCMRPLWVVAFGCDKDRRMRRCRSQQGDVHEVDMSAGRSAKENYIEFLAALHQARQLGRRAHIGNPPAPRLVSERQFEAVAPQSALVDDRKMAASRNRVSRSYVWWESRFSWNGVIEHGQVFLREC